MDDSTRITRLEEQMKTAFAQLGDIRNDTKEILRCLGDKNLLTYRLQGVERAQEDTDAAVELLSAFQSGLKGSLAVWGGIVLFILSVVSGAIGAFLSKWIR